MNPTQDTGPVSGAQVQRAPEVLEGELITEVEYAQRWSLPILAVVATIRESDHPKKITTAVMSGLARSTRIVARACYTVGQGHASWVRRALDALTYGPVREQIRLARLAGDRDALAEWTERLVTLKDGRAERLRALPVTLGAGLRALLVMLWVLAGLLVGVGLWLAFTPGSIGWSGWWSLIKHILDGTLTALTVVVHAVAWGGVPALLVAAWREGRRASCAPRWLFSPDERAEQDAEITADVITAALRHVKIPALARYLSGGGVLEYVITPREQGGGTYTQVRLPMGVTAAELLSSAKVELLAGNLGRHRHEVWPQRETDTDARVLDLWVADKGTMDKPAPAWPLLADGEVDVFTDRLPWGVTMRAEQITVGMLPATHAAGSCARSTTASAASTPTGSTSTRSTARTGTPTSRRPSQRSPTCSTRARSVHSAARRSRRTRSSRRSGCPSDEASAGLSLSSRRTPYSYEASRPTCCPSRSATAWVCCRGARWPAGG